MCQARRSSNGEVARREPSGRPTATDRPDDRDRLLRASDREREAAAEALRAHAAAGRLEVDELETRTAAVLRARTRADIAAALEDLPAVGPTPTVAPTRRSSDEVRAYVAVMTLLLAIWLLTGAGHFWPLYPAVGWGLPLLLGRSCASPKGATAPA